MNHIERTTFWQSSGFNNQTGSILTAFTISRLPHSAKKKTKTIKDNKYIRMLTEQERSSVNLTLSLADFVQP